MQPKHNRNSSSRSDTDPADIRKQLLGLARAANYGAAHPSDTEAVAVFKAIKRDLESKPRGTK